MIKRLFRKLSSLGGNTLYHPGCIARFVSPKIEENYKSLLEGIGIEFIMPPEFLCCGSPVINAGYKEDFEQLMQKSRDMCEKHRVRKIITSCPSCYRMFRENMDIEVEHISQTLYRHTDKIEARWNGEKACYHDPCNLGRHSEIYREPRKVLEAAGLRVMEMATSKEKALCCGAGAGVRNNYSSISAEMARRRLSQCKENLIVTTCPLCWQQLKEYAKEGVRVLEFSEALLHEQDN